MELALFFFYYSINYTVKQFQNIGTHKGTVFDSALLT